jgi:RNA polymerase sigma-70 factor (ECF subfamily)
MSGIHVCATDQPIPAVPDTTADQQIVAALRRGDEEAFSRLIDLYHASLVRLAMIYVGDRAVAEEVAQDTWMAVVTGLDRFEARSSLKTWIFTILTNQAKTRGKRESRSLPFSAFGDADADADEPAVEPARFEQGGQWPGHWARPPRTWDESPEYSLLAGEVRAVVCSAVAELPANQREVISLRDIEGWGSAEVCALLGLTEANQRVLLHRARSRVRGALERYFDAATGDRA